MIDLTSHRVVRSNNDKGNEVFKSFVYPSMLYQMLILFLSLAYKIFKSSFIVKRLVPLLPGKNTTL
jgi:hypothetical protein